MRRIDEPRTGAAIDVIDTLRRGDPAGLSTLRRLGVIRGSTTKQVTGDYAEYLVAGCYGGELSPRNTPGCDVLVGGHLRVSVKARDAGAAHYNYFQVQRRDPPDFDRLVLVEFDRWLVTEARVIESSELVGMRDYDFVAKQADRFRRHGRWRTRARSVDLATVQNHLRYMPYGYTQDD